MALAILRFGELWLKSEGVKRKFMSKLVSNIKALLEAEGIEHSVVPARTRIFATVADKEKAQSVFSRVFGLSSFSFAVEIETDKKEMTKEALLIASGFSKKDTFAVRVKREGNHTFTSQNLAAEIGAKVVEKYGNKVDLTNPNKTIYVEVIGPKAYVFDEKHACAGGLPLGVEGSAVAYFDDETNSVAAAYMIMKRGCRIVPVLKKGIDGGAISKILSMHDPRFSINYIIDDSEKHEKINEIAEKTHSKALVLGEVFGNVAFDDANTELPVFRPLIGMDESAIKDVLKSAIT